MVVLVAVEELLHQQEPAAAAILRLHPPHKDQMEGMVRTLLTAAAEVVGLVQPDQMAAQAAVMAVLVQPQQFLAYLLIMLAAAVGLMVTPDLDLVAQEVQEAAEMEVLAQ